MKARRGIRVATHILNLGTRWECEVNFTLRLHYRRVRNPLPNHYEAGWAPDPVWTVSKKSKSFVSAGFRTPD